MTLMKRKAAAPVGNFSAATRPTQSQRSTQFQVSNFESCLLACPSVGDRTTCPRLGCGNTGHLGKAEHLLLLDLAQSLFHQPTATTHPIYLVTPIIFPILAGVAVSQGNLSDSPSLDELPPA